MSEILSVLETNHGRLQLERSDFWGDTFQTFSSPEAETIPKEALSAISLPEDFPKIPAEIWQRVISLYIHYLRPKKTGLNKPDSMSEVSVVFLRKADDPSIWRCLVPRQEVGAAAVYADFTKGLIDIVTGEEVTQFPPSGWYHAGSSHSHNTMGAFFSGVDDANELTMPGLHAVAGEFKHAEGGGMKYAIAPSIVYKKKRYERVVDPETGEIRKMRWNDIIDASAGVAVFHPRCLDFVTKIVYAAKNFGYAGTGGSGWFKQKGNQYKRPNYQGGGGYAMKEIDGVPEWHINSLETALKRLEDSSEGRTKLVELMGERGFEAAEFDGMSILDTLGSPQEPEEEEEKDTESEEDICQHGQHAAGVKCGFCGVIVPSYMGRTED